MMKKIFFLSLFVSFFATQIQAQTVAPFHKGDRVCYVGNSITDGGRYHSYIWLYYMTHFPKERMWMANCGIGGDTSEDILRRLEGDVFGKRPTVVTVTFGMNDTGYWEYNGDNAEEFGNGKVEWARQNFLKIEDVLKKHDARYVMVGTSPYDHTSKFNDNIYRNKNDYMRKIVDFQRETAKKNNWEFIDFNQPMWDLNQKYQSTDPNYTLIGNDRVHPDNDGHMVMAYLFLKAQGMLGKTVADMDVDAASGKVMKAENCKLSKVKCAEESLEFDYLANSLPYPLDTISHGWGFNRTQEQALRTIPTLVDELSMERLKVRGLKGNYQLAIDGYVIDTLTAAQLEKGVNLANYRQTPQYQQALTVMALNEERYDLEHKFRDWAWIEYDVFLKAGITDVNTPEAYEFYHQESKTNAWLAGRKDCYERMRHPEIRSAINDAMETVIDRIYKENTPVKRHFTLTKIR